MKIVTVNVPLPMTPAEVEAQRAEAERLAQEHNRKVIAQNNRKAGHAEPKAGTSLFVTTAHGLKLRARAGLSFSPMPTEVKVVDLEPAELRAKQVAGASWVDVEGAELILADSNSDTGGLVVYQSKNAAAAAGLEDKSDDELEAEIARRKAAKREGSPDRIKSDKKAAHDAATTDAVRGGNTQLGVGGDAKKPADKTDKTDKHDKG